MRGIAYSRTQLYWRNIKLFMLFWTLVFTYSDAPAAEEDVVLTAKMLAVLPPELRLELRDALVSLVGERISAVIGQVASHDSKLHKTLLHLAENFDYPAILKALQKD